MVTNLRCSEVHWLKLHKAFSTSFRRKDAPETGALALLGDVRFENRVDFMVAHILLPEPGDLKIATRGHLVFSANYLRRAHLLMREKKLAGLALFHTHPDAVNEVAFSFYDDEEEPGLVQNLQEIAPETELVSVVVGKNCLAGRHWKNHQTVQEMNSLTIVGETVAVRSLQGTFLDESPSPAATFDSALAVTGIGVLAWLSQATVAVVGASGTGSLMCEVLMRAGCKKILLFDDDRMETRNGNRVLHSTAEDIEQKRLKVEVIRRAIASSGFNCEIVPIDGSVLDAAILSKLLIADVIFGCVDAAYPRKILCQVAYQYLKPYFDVGTEIGGDEKGIVAAMARANYVAAGRHCLMCTGLVTPRQLGFESKVSSERERVKNLGYSDDLVVKQPAVMDLNMRAVGLGMLMLRHVLQPFMVQPLPATICENLVTFSMLTPSPRALNTSCVICQKNPDFGFGARGTAIGLPSELAKLLRKTG